MTVSFKYWGDCVDPEDMKVMWEKPEVRSEWLNAGESEGQRVHLSRDPYGQPYLTQIEMRAVAEIVSCRHFRSQIDPEMICAIAELESDRQPLAMQYDKKTKLTMIGLMQIAPETAEWMARECGYTLYPVEEDPDVLYRPFENVYFGAAYLKWLSSFNKNDEAEEFVVRAYKGGKKKANHKSTLSYWKRYLSVKESFQSRNHFGIPLPTQEPAYSYPGVELYWDSRVASEDMEQMWNHPDVCNEWTKSRERRGQVRFSYDKEKKPYISRIELKAIAEIIVSKYFSTTGLKPTLLCALAELVSNRFIDGTGARTGIMGIDYATAFWLHVDLGYKAYRVAKTQDLSKPFLSMYFGAAYLTWLSKYEGRERTTQFVVQAYLAGPKNLNDRKTDLMWLKFGQVFSTYEPRERNQSSCAIL